MNKFKAFTLAETLITIAIIGIVSVIAVSNLSKGMNDTDTIVKLKKTVQILEDALNIAITEDGPIENWRLGTSNSAQSIVDHLFPKLKLSKNCTNTTGCWDTRATGHINSPTRDSQSRDNDTTRAKAILSNGASVAIRDGSSVEILIDVDGPGKGPQVYGIDVFSFYFDDDMTPIGDNDRQSCLANSASPICILSNASSSDYYTAWAMYMGNRDYLKCASTLRWDKVDQKTCE